MGHRKRALVVDDHSEARELLAAVLESEGFIVFEARDGEEALDVLEHLPGGSCIVFLDLDMPVMNGHVFLERVRGDQRLRVVVVTGSGVGSVPGVRAVLAKPLTPETLRAVAREHV